MISQRGNNLYIGSKVVGTIKGGDVFMKRNKGRHIYRVLNAWCVNTEILPFATSSLVIDVGNSELYVIKMYRLEQLRAKLNMYITFKDERQLAIPIECWDKFSTGTLPDSIGVSPSEFVENAPGRWKSRIIAQEQLEIQP